MTQEEAIIEIMKLVDKMTPDQLERFLAYLETITAEKE